MQSIVGLGSRDDAAGSEVAKSSVKTGQRRVDPMALFHCMVRYGSARLGTVRYGSVRVGCISTAV